MFFQFHELHKLGTDNFDLGLRLIRATSNVAQAISEELTDYTRRTLQRSAAASERLTCSQTLDAALDLQTDHAKAALDEFFAQSKRLGELFQSLACETATSVASALAEHTAYPPEGHSAPEGVRGDAHTGVSAAAEQPIDRNVMSSAVASAVKDAVNAARQAAPGTN